MKLIPMLATMLWLAALAGPAQALDQEHWHKADAAINRGIAYLRSTQLEDGSWSPQAGPAVTAMVMGVMVDRRDIGARDPAVAKALAYVLSKQQEDGGLYESILPNYNTAICLSALAKFHDQPRVPEVIARAQAFLRGIQWHSQHGPDGQPINESHPFYGGAGYGRHGRPDLSNTQIMLEGLYDSGLDCNDPAFQRALIFITRCQGTTANTQFGDKIMPDGGFIYATSIDKDHIGVPQSMAGEETIDVDGQTVSRLRTYGSMTYAGFKSYLYANLSRSDPRVVDAFNWIRRNYTVEKNPGMPDAAELQGYFYYLMTFSRALDAWAASTIATEVAGDRDWANDLIDQLAALQAEDGSWSNDADRWMEGDKNLVTAYALIALRHASW